MTDVAIIQSLARTGATDAAWAAFTEAGLATATDNPRLLCLKGRLLKDRAMAAPANADRTHLLRAAAEAYGAAARLGEDTYSRINAATLVYLRGDKAGAAALAVEVLAMLDSGAHEAETPYWLGATRAEALLLTGRIADAQHALADAVALAPDAREDRAATLRQFRRILAIDGADDSWLAAHDLAPVLHFRGSMRLGSAEDETAICDAVRAVGPGLAYGALAAGADIVAAEAALAAGAELHVVLPTAPDLFRAASVVPLGDHWGARFDALVDAAATVELLDERGGLTHAAMVLGEWMALGMAVQAATLADRIPVLIEAVNRREPKHAGWVFPHDMRIVRLSAPAGPTAHILPPPDEPSIWIAQPGDGAVEPLPIAIASAVLPTLPPGTVIDVDALGPAGGEPPRFAALRRLERPHALIASRPAALVLETICAGTRSVLIGETVGNSGPVDVYDLLIHSG
jgi:hypothetical protein